MRITTILAAVASMLAEINAAELSMPTQTPPPNIDDARIADSGFDTTGYYDVTYADTSIPYDEYFIGMNEYGIGGPIRQHPIDLPDSVDQNRICKMCSQSLHCSIII